MKSVTVLIGSGLIGVAIARRVSSGKHILLADLRKENADAAATVALLEKEKVRLEGEPGSKARAKKIRTLESVIAQFSAKIAPATTAQSTSRKDKRIDKKLRRKAASVDLDRRNQLH